ncbi:Probable cysteine desulfurase [Mesomycoplasma conjunctivae]|uniref:Nitrogen fixation protein n=1 Tax=Mesomycoplasma conjunctivae (strain ATCC 25834 / NCTC 10147 / HRC/581) TaxID=572263 RepID=C5J684_MESCH|nr:aminotransferase class V-fold PLP-dependent enzyme [Mesomycoplasma conjunctivae]CAT04976.1 Nitrogen fixation protein [Mesomycoplasma conjunctivae]VEU66144.1 Probable cysteine desulfurase [Mesomycoplasma conjunctivae]
MNYKYAFPILKKITYLDSAALVQKPQVVIDAIVDFYSNFAVNNHSINSKIGYQNENKITAVRQKVAKLINGNPQEVIFTSGTTESLNLFAQMIKKNIKPGDEILLSPWNHSSNLLVWIEIAKEKNAKIIYSESLVDKINPKTKIVAFSQVNNTLQVHLDLDEIWKKSIKMKAIVVNDATQAISFQKVDLQKSHVVAFSANKFYGPTGLGILAIQESLLSTLSPSKLGGGTIRYLENDEIKFYNDVKKYEAGTQNLAGIWGLDAAIDFFNELNWLDIKGQLNSLSYYLYFSLLSIPGVNVYSKAEDHIALFSIEGFSAQDVVSALGNEGVHLRSGNFCVPKQQHFFQDNNIIRASLAFYNTVEDIDQLVLFLRKKEFFNFV